MSITSALSSAISGLNASSRAAGVVSTNLANVLTDGYAPREIVLSSQGRIGGVSVVGVSRNVDENLLNERRAADSELAYSEARNEFAVFLENEIGLPGEAGSLNALIVNFESSLTSAAAKPEEDVRLSQAVQSAKTLASKINTVSDSIQRERTEAEIGIDLAVKDINRLLGELQKVNTQIATTKDTGGLSASLFDERQGLVDQISEYIPVKIAPRDNDTIALFSPGGAILIDGPPVELSFTPSNTIAPHMTFGNGLLSGLEINGLPITPSGDSSPIAGGRLSALFEVRDTLAPDAQANIDAIARNLIDRFQDPALDTTRLPGDPGLFTDGGAIFDPLNEAGIAGRVSVNALVDPAQAGEVYRIRDGLGAAIPGQVGDGALLLSLSNTVSTRNALASGGLGSINRSFAEHATAFLSDAGQQRLFLEQSQSFAATRQASLVELELQDGVDSDTELQNLLLVEQAYSANAQMIQTIDEMIDTLLRIAS
ncbi:MAG: flagellar hook-associated protein FlgK [Pseudomonadota bacterium]